MLARTVFAGGRLALRASTSSSRTVSLQHRIALEARRPTVTHGFSSARSYWWSKPAPLEATNASSQTTLAQVETAPRETVAPTMPQAEPIDPTSVATSDVLSKVLPAEASGISDVAASVIPPLQYGDFAALGLSSWWWPPGIIRWSFELLQVSTGMPWFYTIIAGTLLWRVTLVPAGLAMMRNAARLSPFTEQIAAIDAKTKEAKSRTAQMELMLKKQKLIEQAGVSLASMSFAPLVQMVGNVGLFFAIKGIVQLPVEQLRQSGVVFLPDLTATGDYVMPMFLLLAMHTQFWVARKELDPTKPAMAHTMNFMRMFSVAALPMMSMMPTGLWLSVITGLILSTTQSLLLRVPRIRQAVGIPPSKPAPLVTMRDTCKWMLEWIREKTAAATARQAANQKKPNWTSLPRSSSRRPRFASTKQ